MPMIFFGGMLSTVSFDYKAAFRAEEIGNLGTKLHLSAKPEAGNLFAAQH